MNTIIYDNREYKIEGLFRDKNNIIDTHGNKFKKLIHSNKKWTGKNQLIDRLNYVQTLLSKNIMIDNMPEKCNICKNDIIDKKLYRIKKIVWGDNLIHFIDKHNYKPSDEFMRVVYQYDPIHQKRDNILRLKSKVDSKYVVITRNQINILDALMIYGGFKKKYVDTSNEKIFRYSEHAGYIDFDKMEVDKIIVSGNTSRVDRGDEEIYLPENIDDAIEYEYLYHTYPPTPKIGGRVNMGILYEFPSMGDLLHFIDHHNDGRVSGSLVVCAEGMYNIRKLQMNNDLININENKLFRNYTSKMAEIQNKSIKKYGKTFTDEKFYSKISQDTEPIDTLNNILEEFNLIIDYYPREKDSQGNWIINTLYLPIYRKK